MSPSGRGGTRGQGSIMGFAHQTVMTDEVVQFLEPRDGGRYVDATLGGGGHAAAILEASSPTGTLLGIDRDPDAIAAARHRLAAFGDRVTLVCDRYSRLPEILKEREYGHHAEHGPEVDGLVLDAGVSSHQLDTPDRGFSFREDGPLDMRMGQAGLSCAELLDQLDNDGLRRILREYGEVKRPGFIANRILEARRQGALETTAQLAELVASLSPPRYGAKQIHPATLVFQALRIAVNGELDELASLCDALPTILREAGVAVIISFHSLEDRTVKKAFNKNSRGPAIPAGVPLRQAELELGPLDVLTKRPVRPGATEIETNARARSAKLRAIRRRQERSSQP